MTIARIQTANVAGSPASVTSVSVAFPSNVTAGDLLIAYCYVYAVSPTLSVTDTLGNTYGISTVANGAIGSTLAIAHCISGSSGANTVQLSNGGVTGTGIGLVIEEYSGVSGLDTTNSVSDQTSATPSVSLTTTTDHDLVVCVAIEQASATVTPGLGFTLGVQTTAKWWEVTEYDLDAGTAGSFTGSFGLSGSARASMMIKSFTASSGGGPLPTALMGQACL